MTLIRSRKPDCSARGGNIEELVSADARCRDVDSSGALDMGFATSYLRTRRSRACGKCKPSAV